ncbi:hypothetical protein C4K38_4939 [Pseudomonas chlororaphis subsp. piscium]|nr:hypothetical protein C4K38_4939 [Pseudomonas chlororaphis subsp. piscium]
MPIRLFIRAQSIPSWSSTEVAMSNVQIGLLVLFGISAFGFVTLSIDLWRARRLGKGK